jgi:hypothetical protein
MDREMKYAVDWVAVSVTVATLTQWLPSIAALFTVIWGFFRILSEIEKWRERRERRLGKQRRWTDRSNP